LYTNRSSKIRKLYTLCLRYRLESLEKDLRRWVAQCYGKKTVLGRIRDLERDFSTQAAQNFERLLKLELKIKSLADLLHTCSTTKLVLKIENILLFHVTHWGFKERNSNYVKCPLQLVEFFSITLYNSFGYGS
jgi:hypothetical protein